MCNICKWNKATGLLVGFKFFSALTLPMGMENLVFYASVEIELHRKGTKPNSLAYQTTLSFLPSHKAQENLLQNSGTIEYRKFT